MSSPFAYMPARQNRASDLVINICKLPCSCWELNLGPLKKQSVLLISELLDCGGAHFQS